ncbi:MAG: glycosyltransferase, partial [Thermodesulfobacteriota bacterium]
MKILFVSPSYWPAYQFGGPIQSLHLLNKALNKNGAEITVYSTNIGLENKVKSDREIIVEGINVKYFSYSRMFEFVGTTGWQFSLPLTKALKENVVNYDLVYILSIWNYPTAIASYYCRKFGVPYVISPRGSLYEEVLKNSSLKKLLYYNLFSKRDIENASAIHYTTLDEYQNCHYKLSTQPKALIIPNGISLDEFRNLPGKGEFISLYPHLKNKDIILFLGRLTWKKGLDLLIDSFSAYLKTNDNAHLVLAGNDENGYKNTLTNKLNRNNISFIDLTMGNETPNKSIDTHVTFTGFLDNGLKKKALVDSEI